MKASKARALSSQAGPDKSVYSEKPKLTEGSLTEEEQELMIRELKMRVIDRIEALIQVRVWIGKYTLRCEPFSHIEAIYHPQWLEELTIVEIKKVLEEEGYSEIVFDRIDGRCVLSFEW